LRRADPPFQGVLSIVYRVKKLKSSQCPTERCRAINNNNNNSNNNNNRNSIMKASLTDAGENISFFMKLPFYNKHLFAVYLKCFMDNVMQYDQVWNCEDVECGHGLFSDTI
jgi:hypothetical protein